jgi:hypothetical protein
MKRMKMIEKKMEQREKKERNNNRNRGNKRKYRKGGGRMVRKGDRGESERKRNI